MGHPVPTLTVEGFISAIDRKCDRILMNAFASDASQSNIFKGSVVSIQNLIYENSDDIPAAGTAIANALQRVLAEYFDSASVRATVKELPDRPGRYDIAIQGTVVENLRKYDFGRMVETANGLVQKIMNKQGDVLWTQ